MTIFGRREGDDCGRIASRLSICFSGRRTPYVPTPQASYPIPEETQRVARAAFPRGNLYMQVADQLSPFYHDVQFTALFPIDWKYVLGLELADPGFHHTVLSEFRRGQLEIWPLHLRQPLPIVPVPLQYPDPDVPLDVGKALHAIYDRAAYDLRLDYTQTPPEPALAPDDAQWVAELLTTAGLRG